MTEKKWEYISNKANTNIHPPPNPSLLIYIVASLHHKSLLSTLDQSRLERSWKYKFPLLRQIHAAPSKRITKKALSATQSFSCQAAKVKKKTVWPLGLTSVLHLLNLWCPIGPNTKQHMHKRVHTQTASKWLITGKISSVPSDHRLWE